MWIGALKGDCGLQDKNCDWDVICGPEIYRFRPRMCWFGPKPVDLDLEPDDLNLVPIDLDQEPVDLEALFGQNMLCELACVGACKTWFLSQ